jgi:hypothetical protein
MRVPAVFAAVILLTSPATAQSELVAACQNVYATSTVNITTEQRHLAELTYIRDNMCSGSQLNSNFNLDSGAEAVIEAVPVKGNLSFGSSKAKAEYICQNFESLVTSDQSLATFSRQVQVAALNSFNAQQLQRLHRAGQGGRVCERFDCRAGDCPGADQQE